MKVIFDTSVLLAAFYKPIHGPSFSKDVFDYAADHLEIHVSPEILREFERKCVAKLKLPTPQVDRLVSLIQKKSSFREVKRGEVVIPKDLSIRDINDLHVLELAIAVGADLILAWDKDLLSLKQINAIRIVSPREFWDALQ